MVVVYYAEQTIKNLLNPISSLAVFTVATLKDGLAKLHFSAAGAFPRSSPKGVYDRNILCIDCEASLSDWDNYANDLFMRTCPDGVIHGAGEPQAELYNNFDRYKLQMFFISLIWRMQISRQPMFKNMQLGQYEKNLKLALVERNPNLVPELDVVLFKFNSPLSRAFLGPTKLRISGVNGYRVCFAHHTCWVKIDKRPFPLLFQRGAISQTEPLHIILREFDGSPEKKALLETFKYN